MKSILRMGQKTLKRRLKHINWGSFQNSKPISNVFGFDRGLPIDRYFIEKFLNENKMDIQGVVLEIGDNHYTTKFGGTRIGGSEVLHAVPGNPSATIVGDLASGEGIPKSFFDCIILTQTLPFIYDVHSVIRTSYEALKPDGVLLVTVPGISQISRYDMDRWGDYWRFTDLSVLKLFMEFFNKENLQIEIFGNVKTAVAFLHGIASEELNEKDLHFKDPDYQLIIGVRGKKRNS